MSDRIENYTSHLIERGVKRKSIMQRHIKCYECPSDDTPEEPLLLIRKQFKERNKNLKGKEDDKVTMT